MSDTIPVEMMTNIYFMRFRNKDQKILEIKNIYVPCVFLVPEGGIRCPGVRFILSAHVTVLRIQSESSERADSALKY